MYVPSNLMPYLVVIFVPLVAGTVWVTRLMARRNKGVEAETHWIVTGRVPIPATLIEIPDPRPMMIGRVPQLAIGEGPQRIAPDTISIAPDISIANWLAPPRDTLTSAAPQLVIESDGDGVWQTPRVDTHPKTVPLAWHGPTHARRICEPCYSGMHRSHPPASTGECIEPGCACPIRPMRAVTR